MKKYNELSREEKREVTELFANWLKDYTHEVIIKVMARAEEIINNEFAMNLLKELRFREVKEEKDFTYSIESLFDSYDTMKEFDVHNHPLEHSKSYKDILADMYIR
jgi:hypothetical protein